MAPALKAKRIKKSTKPNSSAVAKLKPKWEKPRKSISAQPGVTKIKKVNKRSFDPLKANRGVVLLKNIPHGFYEDEMRKYFGQFGLVTRVRLARSERTGRSKGFAYIEFKVPEVAQIAAETMNNYIMFKHMLKTVYIPPDKQTYNFFRKDVTFTTDADGDTSFSSAKTASIEKAIETINRVPTDEEHAKRLKRNQKALQKQQKKYGLDLSNILVSGNSSSSDAAPTTEVKAKESKKKALAAKKADEKKEKKTITKHDDNKIANKKKVAGGVTSSTNGGESLLQGLLDKTFETDTSDEDFKIDHSFNASVEDSDDSDDESGHATFADLLAKKLVKKSMDSSVMETSDSDDDAESDDGESDDDGQSDADGESIEDEEELGSEFDNGSGDFDEFADSDSEPEDLRQILNDKKKSLEGRVTSNGAQPNLKRKLKDDSSSIVSELGTSTKQLESLVAKKMRQNPTNKKAVPSKASIPKQEPPKIALKKKNTKPNRPPLNTTTSSSEPESRLPQTRQKKLKLAAQVESTSKLLTANGKQKMKKAKQGLNSSITDTTSSEPEIPKQKLNKKKATDIASKPENVTVQAQKVKPTVVILQTKTQNKKNKPAKIDEIKSNPKTSASEVAEPEVQKSKKRNQPKAKGQQINSSPTTVTTTSAEPNVQKPGKKNKQKTVIDVESTAKPEPVKVDKTKKKVKPVTSSLISGKIAKKPIKTNSTTAKANSDKLPEKSSAWSTVSETDGEPVQMDKKQKKVKPVTSSLISENGFAKKSIKANSGKLSEKSSAWATVSETDGEEPKKPKTKGVKANLKTIVHKKKNDANAKPHNAKKIKQTPDELLQLITSKDLKQKNQLKSKKKSK